MTARRLRAAALLLVVWLVGAGLATSIGLLAVRQVAAQVGDPAAAPLTAAAATRAATTRAPGEGVGASTAPSTRPSGAPASPRPSTAPAQVPSTATFRSAGGALGLQCDGTAARLLYAAPADGYALDERSVSGSRVEARFESGGSKVRMDLSCATGRPRLLDVRSEPGGERGGGPDDNGSNGKGSNGGVSNGGGSDGGGSGSGGGRGSDGGGSGGTDD